MTFTEVEKHINLSYGKRIPQALNEMMWCEPLAVYLNKKYGTHYDDVYKTETLDKVGIDVVLSSKHVKTELPLHIQLTHAREYDMSPQASSKEVDLTGKPILDAISYKCEHYLEKGIDPKKLVLIIQGVLPENYVHELMSQNKEKESILHMSCFDGIYYISDKVYPLVELSIED